MKKSKGFICVCTTLLIVMLASCTSQEEDNNLEATDVGTVQIKITQDVIETRTGAVASVPIANNATLEIDKGGHIYFVSASGNITKYVQILPSTGGTGDKAATVGLSELQAGGGVTITGVPSSSKTVHIFMNLPDRINNLPKATSVPFKSVTDSLVQVVELANSTSNLFDVKNVPVSGSGNLTADGDNLQATVSVSPIASRIEIGTIKTAVGTGNNAKVTIKSFELRGIFINNYYSQLKLDNVYVDADKRNAGSVVANYTEGNAGFWWRTGNINPQNYGQYLFTGNGGTTKFGVYDPTTNPTSVKAHATNTWGYNIFPGTATYEPHIVIRLANVVLNDKTAPTPTAGTDYPLTADQYVTVKGFKTAAGATITGLQRGYVYKLGTTTADFTITPDNLTEEPETNPISAKVTISLVKWIAQEVKPEY
jgi:hypothetical protein